MRLVVIIFSFIGLFQKANAQVSDGVLIRCGASAGHAFFFEDPVFNPSASDWIEDGMTKGEIILVKFGEEWDIQFDDVLGSTGYRQDGAKVSVLLAKPKILMVGAFNTNYVDIYTFDFEHKVVAWSSNKMGPFARKVAVYVATCD